MSISDEEIKIIQQALHYSIMLERETRNSEQFRDAPSIRGKIDTEIWHIEQLRDNISDRTEEELMDDRNLCMALVNATIFLTPNHPGRLLPENREEVMEQIKKVKEKFCKKKDHEYYQM